MSIKSFLSASEIPNGGHFMRSFGILSESNRCGKGCDQENYMSVVSVKGDGSHSGYKIAHMRVCRVRYMVSVTCNLPLPT
jgi:hypothetical protein